MASFWDFLFGGTSPVGSASDVSMVNQQGYSDFMKGLQNYMGDFGKNLGGYASSAAKGYSDVSQTAGNYDNFFRSMMGGGGLYDQMSKATNNFNPNASLNAFMSQQPAFAEAANKNIAGALSDVYSTGRSQAAAAADQARRQASSDLAAAGLLNSGAGVGSMMEASARPTMEMETNLANIRSNALLNQLGQLQGQGAGLLGQGYGNAANMAQMAANLGLQARQGQTAALEAGAAGQSGLAGLYGNLLGQGLGIGSEMNQPYYYTPSYQQNPGLLDYALQIGNIAASAGTGGLSNILGGLFGAGGQSNPQFNPYPWETDSTWRNAYSRGY